MDMGFLQFTNFNPRTPCGVRQSPRATEAAGALISIHAPLAGCDRGRKRFHLGNIYFNPRTPCGVRQGWEKKPQHHPGFQSTHPLRGATLSVLTSGVNWLFQSTHPLRGATPIPATILLFHVFQSTHPLRGATVTSDTFVQPFSNFNPRTPCGVRQNIRIDNNMIVKFQSTHPLRGATFPTLDIGDRINRFQSTHPLRGATQVR